MNAKLVLVLCLAVVVAADSSYGPPRHSSRSHEFYEPREARYNFDWRVKHEKSGNDYGHQEGRDGDSTKGSYYVHLPDGRLQTVNYYVEGKSGYIADVKYDGEARHDSASYESYERPSFQSYERPSFESFERSSHESFERSSHESFERSSHESYERP